MNTHPYRFTFFLACAMLAALSGQAILRAASRPSPAQAIRKAMTSDPLTHTELKYNLQFIDAEAFVPTKNGGLKNAASASGPLGWLTIVNNSRSGALADGLSVLVIRVVPPFPSGQDSPAAIVEPYPITFKISDAAGDPASVIGSISATLPTLPAPIGGAASVVGAKPQVTITILAGQPAMVYYCPPERFLSPPFPQDEDGNEPLDNRQISVDASSATQDLAAGPLDVVRPQIVLVHGVCSGPGTWANFVNHFTLGASPILPADQFVKVDYSQSNTSGYDLNASALPLEISNTIRTVDRFPNSGPTIAATRLDVVGHSMGGVLTAWYASDLGNVTLTRGDGFANGAWNSADSPYRRANDFGVGDIRRFISIGSPFDGSPWATFVCNAFSYAAISYAVAHHVLGSTGNAEAAWDLQPDSGATGYLERANPPIEWCPIAGIAGNDALGFPWDTLYQIFQISPAGVGLTTANSDLVVPQISAENAVGAPAGTKVTTAANVAHTSETENTGIDDEVQEALDFTAAGGGTMFNGQF